MEGTLKENAIPRLTAGEIKSIATANLSQAWADYKGHVREEASGVMTFTDELRRWMPESAQSHFYDPLQLSLLSRGFAAPGQELMKGMGSVSAAGFYEIENRPLFAEAIIRTLFEKPIQGNGYAQDSDVLADTILVNGGVAEYPVITDTEGPLLRRLSQAADIPLTSISVSASTSYLYDIGVAFKIPYSVSRRWGIDMLGIAVRRRGQQMRKDIADIVIAMLIDSISQTETGTTAWKYDDISDVVEEVDDDGFSPNILVSSSTVKKALLKLSEFKDPLLFDRARTGNVASMIGCRLLKARSGAGLSTNLLAAIDGTQAAVQLIEAGSEISEADKFILGRSDVFTYSVSTAFFRTFTNAIKMRKLKGT